MEDAFDSKIRILTRRAYQIQKSRIQEGNRLIAHFRRKMGVDPNEEVQDDDKREILESLELRYKRITDGVAEVTRRRTYDFDTVIEDFTDLRLVDFYMMLKRQEDKVAGRDMKVTLRDVDIWAEWLSDVTGIGPRLGGVLISELNPHKAPYPSSFWAYCGLDVVNGEGRSRKEEHMKEVEYENSDGEMDTRKSLGYNPFIKSRLMDPDKGAGAQFLRHGTDPYEQIMRDYKHRIQTDPNHDSKSDGHIHMMTLRKGVKEFLIDLHCKWRWLEDLPVAPPYRVEKQDGSDHGRADRLGVEYDFDHYRD